MREMRWDCYTAEHFVVYQDSWGMKEFCAECLLYHDVSFLLGKQQIAFTRPQPRVKCFSIRTRKFYTMTHRKKGGGRIGSIHTTGSVNCMAAQGF